MYLNVFRSRKREGHDAQGYAADAARMAQLAARQPGFIGYKSYTAPDGETVTISEWETEVHAQDWGRHPEHAAVQHRGRAEYYEGYTMFACARPRVHRFGE